VLYADGDIDKPGYELLRDKALTDLNAATAELDRLQVVGASAKLPPLETVLTTAEGWGAAMQGGSIAAQRDVLAALIDRVVPVRVGNVSTAGRWPGHRLAKGCRQLFCRRRQNQPGPDRSHEQQGIGERPAQHRSPTRLIAAAQP
jgi:hypothetical protein